VPGLCAILYADDILLIALSVCGLDDVMKTCERQLDKHDMVIMQESRAVYALEPGITLYASITNDWCYNPVGRRDQISGYFYRALSLFKCSLDHAKKSFYRAANAIFAKVGRIASEEVTLQLSLPLNQVRLDFS